MRIARLELVEKEAKKLLAKIACLKEVKSKDIARYGHITGCRETASVRRQSMELTRALADLRKSN